MKSRKQRELEKQSRDFWNSPQGRELRKGFDKGFELQRQILSSWKERAKTFEGRDLLKAARAAGILPPVPKRQTAPQGTVAAEARCERHLAEAMKASPDRKPFPKSHYQTEYLKQFPGLSKRAFARAWTRAIESSGAASWAESGRRNSPHLRGD